MSLTLHIKSGQKKWDVAIEPQATVAQLKEEIAKVSEIPSANQRLIYSGKILKDDMTVESYKIQNDHSIHLVRSGGGGNHAASNTPAPATTAAADGVPGNLAAGQTSGFNPLADLTSARYAGYLNLPSADMFGPDGGMNSSATAPSQDDMLRMLENPVFQSQMNEMLSNPQMIDFMIQSNPQLQALGPQARQMFQSPLFRQMLTNPDMIRQSMQMANMMNGGAGGTTAAASSFPAPGETTAEQATTNTTETNTNAGAANPFASLLNSNSANTQQTSPGSLPAFNPSLLAQMFQQRSPAPAEEDRRPPEERYESQLRQLNDMGFFDFDRNVAALRRSGGSVQGALDALLNGDV